MGVGRREAFGVRQLAAALFLCTNNLPGTRSALRTRQRACPRIDIRGVPAQTSAAVDWNKAQFARHAAITGQNPKNEPFTLSDYLPSFFTDYGG
ncbi:MAG: hypothetical protein GX456_14845 [Verrucomicrobia bacterium]|nr:hypothetical protein [Verrucomicrobiota bacterium]